MQISDNGLKFLENEEVLKLHSYRATASEQYLTIGYGHYGSDVTADMVITQEKAVELLSDDVSWAENTVNELVTVELTQNQFDAIVSLVFNIGATAFKNSHALQMLNESDYDAFADGVFDEAHGFVRQAGKVLQGLVNRRKKERMIFEDSNYSL